jgi:hypothetical protein
VAPAPHKRFGTGVFEHYGTRARESGTRECQYGGGIAENSSKQKQMIWFLIFDMLVVVNLV